MLFNLEFLTNDGHVILVPVKEVFIIIFIDYYNFFIWMTNVIASTWEMNNLIERLFTQNSIVIILG